MRKALDPANERTFVATRGPDRCIVLYPVEVWKKVEEKLVRLNKGPALNRHYARNYVRHAESLQYDQQGRVALAADLISYAGINRHVVIVGMINYIEIWDGKLLEELGSEMEERQEELESVAAEINL